MLGKLSTVRTSNPNKIRNALLSVGTLSKHQRTREHTPTKKQKGMPVFPQTSRANFFAGAIASGSIEYANIGLPQIGKNHPDDINMSNHHHFSNPPTAHTNKRSHRNMHNVQSGVALDAAEDEYYLNSDDAKI